MRMAQNHSTTNSWQPVCEKIKSNCDMKWTWQAKIPWPSQSKTSTANLSPLNPSHHFSAFSYVTSFPAFLALSTWIFAAASATPFPSLALPQIYDLAPALKSLVTVSLSAHTRSCAYLHPALSSSGEGEVRLKARYTLTAPIFSHSSKRSL